LWFTIKRKNPATVKYCIWREARKIVRDSVLCQSTMESSHVVYSVHNTQTTVSFRTKGCFRTQSLPGNSPMNTPLINSSVQVEANFVQLLINTSVWLYTCNVITPALRNSPQLTLTWTQKTPDRRHQRCCTV
jgi:hypothetical protein